MLIFKKTFSKLHKTIDDGSESMQKIVKKTEDFADQTEELIKSSGNSIKIIAGFVVVSMCMQMAASHSQLKVNMKMLQIMKGMK